jgi:hypothetical protein
VVIQMTVNRREWLIAASAAAGGILAATSGCATREAAARPAQRVSRPDTAQSFSDDYQAARSKFLAAAEAAGARIENHRLPGFDGPDGQALFMDSAWIGPADADVVVVSVCGTHGAEGFCGSAAQIDWLLNEGPRRALPTGVATLLVHAVNPFGFAYLLRTNEHSVNINRNSIDFTQPLPANPTFEEIFATFPTRQGYDEDLVAAFDAAYAAAEAKHGRWEVSDALGRGQYTNDQGPEFGGVRSEWSSRTLFDVLRRSCSSARHVTYIDWHTLINIGDGQLVYLCFNQMADPLFERAGRWWTREAIARDTVNRQWSSGTSNRRPSRHGILMWGVQHALAPGADVAGAVIEFCADSDRLIFSPQPSMRDWVYARWLRHTRDFTSPAGRFVAAYLREVASPTRRSFQEAALQAARDCYRRAIAGAGEWAQENVPATPGVLTSYSTFT